MKHNFLLFFILIILSACISCEEILQESNSKARPSTTTIASIHNLKNVNTYIETSNEELVAAMEMTIQTKVQYQPLIPIAAQVQNLTAQFHQHIDELKDLMAQESGGIYTESDIETEANRDLIGLPKDGNNKKVVKQIFISGQYGAAQHEPQGNLLGIKLEKLKDAYIQLIAELWESDIRGTIFVDRTKREAFLNKLQSNISVSNYNHLPRGTDWAEENFKDKTIAETYLTLAQYQNRVNLAASTVLRSLSRQMGRLELTYDKFDVLAQSQKPYVLLGETYEAEIALGAYSSQARFSVSVGGSSLSIIDGKAKYTARPSSIGEKSYDARITVRNPMTDELETFVKTFKYEVGQPAVLASADKQNILYIGVDNPITIAATGISTSSIKISMIGGSLHKASSTGYLAQVTKPGKVIITVKDTKNGKSFPFQFRVKRIPNPVVKMGKNVDGMISSTNFKAQLGLTAILEDFDYDAKCNVQSYTVLYTRKRQDPVLMEGKGGRFSGKVFSAIRQAKPGDQYSFTDVNVRCPGDQVARRINGLSFNIK